MIDIIGKLIVPSGIILILITVAITLSLFPRKRRLALWPALSALGIYIVFGSGLVAHALLGPLERWYEPVTSPTMLGKVDVIIVLTGYASRHEEVSPPSWLTVSTAYRVLETMWLKEHHPDTRILISGGLSSAKTIRDALLSLSLGPGEVFLDAEAVDTAASASSLNSRIRSDENCALVTSAGHMPRSYMALKRQDLSCHPVPTEFYTPFELGVFDYLPSPNKLILSDHAIHEYVGIAWYWLRDKI